MLKAVLIDLDNTILFVDEMEFMLQYLPQVAEVFSDLLPQEEFQPRLIQAAQAFMKNNGEKSNKEYFLEVFSPGLAETKEEIWGRFMRYYDTGFERLRSLVSAPEGVRDLLEELKRRDLKLVIATNPVWPHEVQMKRLTWAGVGDVTFDLVTSLENMSFCKPELGYYQEICAKIGEHPEACLMVGNDPVNDMIGAKIGMKTYLFCREGVDDGSLSVSRRSFADRDVDIMEPDFRGDLSDLPGVVDGLRGG